MMTDSVNQLAQRLVTILVFRSILEKAQQSQVLTVHLKLIKVKFSEEYFEERKDLNRFLLQCDLYI